MTLEEYNKNLEKSMMDMELSLGNTMVKIGQSALVKIKQRVQEEGKNADGKDFPPYSQKPMLANCSSMTTGACSQIAGSKSKRRELKWVTLQRGGRNIKLFEIEGGYKKFRELHGRQTDHVDFMFYGSMWGDITILSNNSQHNSGVVVIGPKTSEQMKKLEGNTKRKGTILDLSEKELIELAGTFKVDTLQILRNNGI
jgi:hypothetical protein